MSETLHHILNALRFAFGATFLVVYTMAIPILAIIGHHWISLGLFFFAIFVIGVQLSRDGDI